jgi:glycerol-3-phosphate dehydrogenase
MTRTDVLVIGGGATGLGIAWDLTLRGLSVVLVEMGDLSSGTSGRYHGLLHSGARYVVSDPPTARECIQENAVLRRIAPHTIDDTGGLFVLAASDDPSFVETWLGGCRSTGVPVRELSMGEAREREPMLHPGILRAFAVPDAVCHSLALAASLGRAAEERGASLLPFHKLDGFIMNDRRVEGARVSDLRTGQILKLRARIVVNAAGPWAGQVARHAGIDLPMDLSRGAMVAFKGRLVSSAVQRLCAPGDADAILPRGRVSIGGTTAVATTDPADRRIEPWEIELITARLAEILPGLRAEKLVHAWSAVRPLFDPEGREASADARTWSRGFSVLDHAESHGPEGIVTVVGGKLATYRLMAEKTADLICDKLGIKASCRTADTQIG